MAPGRMLAAVVARGAEVELLAAVAVTAAVLELLAAVAVAAAVLEVLAAVAVAAKPAVAAVVEALLRQGQAALAWPTRVAHAGTKAAA